MLCLSKPLCYRFFVDFVFFVFFALCWGKGGGFGVVAIALCGVQINEMKKKK